MPFRSTKQRALFYAKMKRGEFSPEMVKKWEEHTPKDKKLPKYVEKKAMAQGFWSGFQKRAVDTFVSANNLNETPGAPEKMLKWNDHGGVDPRQPEEMQAAQAAMLVTLPPDVEGASCATCMHFRPITAELDHGFCTNPQIKMDVTGRMHCINWSHPGVHDPVAAAAEEEQQMQVEQAMAAQQGGISPQSYGGQVPPDVMGQTQAPGDYSGQIPQDANTKGVSQTPAGQGMTMQPQTTPEAQTTEGNTGTEYQPSQIGAQTGFPLGKQTNANPMAEQAVSDFQGQGAVGGPTGVENEQPAPKKPAKSKSSSGNKESSKKKKSGDKGHTININVGNKEKTASIVADCWKGIVEGY